MAAVQLRRYGIKPGHWDEFLEFWRRVVEVRRRHGFVVLLAFADRTANVFTWAIEFVGDIDAAERNYYKDPDRVALAGIGKHVTSVDVNVVDRLAIPGQP